jgi:hypothetical protein
MLSRAADFAQVLAGDQVQIEDIILLSGGLRYTLLL